MENLDYIHQLTRRIADHPSTYDSVCASASLCEEIKKHLAAKMLERQKDLIFFRNEKRVEVLIEPWQNDGIQITVSGEYRDGIKVYLDSILVWMTSCTRTVCITRNGIF